jgi:hypothetical protein
MARSWHWQNSPTNRKTPLCSQRAEDTPLIGHAKVARAVPRSPCAATLRPANHEVGTREALTWNERPAGAVSQGPGIVSPAARSYRAPSHGRTAQDGATGGLVAGRPRSDAAPPAPQESQWVVACPARVVEGRRSNDGESTARSSVTSRGNAISQPCISRPPVAVPERSDEQIPSTTNTVGYARPSDRWLPRLSVSIVRMRQSTRHTSRPPVRYLRQESRG